MRKFGNSSDFEYVSSKTALASELTSKLKSNEISLLIVRSFGAQKCQFQKKIRVEGFSTDSYVFRCAESESEVCQQKN